MNKKVMALAVAGAFAAPALVHAQASNVQIYGTAYIEYGYAKQGTGPNTPTALAPGFTSPLNNIDLLQTPGSSIGFKGEEALGGGLSAWFQCESSMDLRGANSQNLTASTATTQNSGIFCGRNSALGLKGNFGNVFAGNWDSPWKQNSPQIMGTNETGVFGVAPMLYGNSTSTNDGDNGIVFERRQGNSINYISPTFSGFKIGVQVSTPQRSAALTSNTTQGKPRLWSLGVNYTNGPLILTGNYEQHSNFNTLGGAAGSNHGTTDTGWMVGAAYQFGPVKVGGVYAKRNWDGGCNIASLACSGDASVQTWGLNADWHIQGPHEVKVAYIKADSTKGGSFGTNPATGAAIAPSAGMPLGGVTVGNLVFNGGAGSTGSSMWEIEYLYNLSKRTRVSVGYVAINNDSAARYGLSGFTAPSQGVNQSAFGTSIKSTF